MSDVPFLQNSSSIQHKSYDCMSLNRTVESIRVRRRLYSFGPWRLRLSVQSSMHVPISDKVQLGLSPNLAYRNRGHEAKIIFHSFDVV